jgi:hypothetical protein
MAGPGDEIAAGAEGRGRLRASHADREHVIETLKAAFVQGRLAKDEFDARVGQAFASRTYAQLAAVTEDLPAGLVAAQPLKPPLVQPPPPVVTDVKTAARMIATATAIPAALWAFVFLAPPRYTDNGGVALLVLWSTALWLIFLLLVGADVLVSRDQKRSGGQLPPPPDSSGRSIPGTTGPLRSQRPPPRDTSRIRHSATLRQPSPAANPSS